MTFISHTAHQPIRRSFVVLSLLALAAMLVLAACSDDSDDSEQPAQDNPAPTQALDDPTPEPEPSATEPPAEDAVAESEPTQEPTAEVAPEQSPAPDPTETPAPEPEPLDVPPAAFLENMTHMYQTMNNCSAASVCMLLSHYDIILDQEALRPYMRPNDNAKHGKYEYIIGFLREQGFHAEVMHGGDVETLKAFLAYGIPVIVQQWLDPQGDPIGHYRVVRGYDDNAGVFRVNDSMNGNDVHYTYETFNEMWRAFSYRFIPVYPPEQEEIVNRILGERRDHDVNRQRTAERIRAELESRPEDAQLWYSLGTNLYDLGRYDEAIEAYERARSIGLPPKMLWYVYWPPAAYNEAGRHEEALRIANEQVASAVTFGEMHYERGRAFEGLGDIQSAIAAYRQALSDDPKLTEAQEALARLGVE